MFSSAMWFSVSRKSRALSVGWPVHLVKVTTLSPASNQLLYICLVQTLLGHHNYRFAYRCRAVNMDFKALMSAEISKTQPASSSTASTAPTKYLKRADLEAQRRQTYQQEQRAIQADKVSKALKKRKHEEDEAERTRERDEKRRRLAEESRRRREDDEEKQERARRKRLGLPDLPAKSETATEGTTPPADGDEDVAADELVRRLRAMGEPTRLFGESHRQTQRRHRRLMERAAAAPLAVLTTGPIPTTLALVPEAEMKVAAGTVPADGEGRRFLFRQLASYFTMVLTEWGTALAQRPESVKGSFQGKAAYNAMVQSRENMRPLFKKFEKGELEEGILGPVVEIVRAAQERRYVDANDGYLTLSIGKA